MLKKIDYFLRDESGAAVVEYSLIIALIALGMILVFEDLGTALNSAMNEIAETLNNVMEQNESAG